MPLVSVAVEINARNAVVWVVYSKSKSNSKLLLHLLTVWTEVDSATWRMAGIGKRKS